MYTGTPRENSARAVEQRMAALGHEQQKAQRNLLDLGRTEPLTAARVRAQKATVNDLLRQHTLVTLDQAGELHDHYHMELV